MRNWIMYIDKDEDERLTTFVFASILISLDVYQLQFITIYVSNEV